MQLFPHLPRVASLYPPLWQRFHRNPLLRHLTDSMLHYRQHCVHSAIAIRNLNRQPHPA